MPRAKAYSLFVTCPYTWLCVRGDVGKCDHNPLIEPLFTLFASIPSLSTALSYLDGSIHDLMHPSAWNTNSPKFAYGHLWEVPPSPSPVRKKPARLLRY